MKHALLICLCVVLALGACTDERAAITGTQSLKIDVVTPANLGSVTTRLPDTARTVTVNITAKDADDNDDPSYSKPVQVYVHFLGTLTPYLDGTPLQTIQVTNGKATNQTINLPPVFGPTTIWFDDGKATDATYATGVSPTLWFRDPVIADIQTPTDETAVDALINTPLATKNITVDQSRYGANGRLVVTSTFAQGYTVADVNCSNAAGAPPCVAQDYDYIVVFSFSAPADQKTRFIYEGQLIDGFSGGISEFNGLTEIGFPQTFVSGDPDINPAREPAPSVFDATWFTNKIMFERNEAAAIEIDGAKVCPIDADYTTYKQWKIDPSGVASAAICGDKTDPHLINVITSGVLDIDPATLVGKSLTKIVGVLRPVEIVNPTGPFNVWIIYPRSMADLTM